MFAAISPFSQQLLLINMLNDELNYYKLIKKNKKSSVTAG